MNDKFLHKDQLNAANISVKKSIEDSKLEVTQINEYLKEDEINILDTNSQFLYLLSINWLNQWKKYICYDDFMSNNQPDLNALGESKLDPINSDLISREELEQGIEVEIDTKGREKINPVTYKRLRYTDSYYYGNKYLKPNLKQDVDYKLISKTTWAYLIQRYPGEEIKRPIYKNADNQRKVEVNLKQFKVIFVSSSMLKKIDYGSVKEFNKYKLQTYSKIMIKDLKTHLISMLNSESQAYEILDHDTAKLLNKFNSENCRLWKLDSSTNNLYKNIRDSCSKCIACDYKIQLSHATYLEKNNDALFDDYNITDKNYILVEIRDFSKGWHFIGNHAPMIDRCENCNKYSNLQFTWSCGKVRYCSLYCKLEDKKYHLAKCQENHKEEEEEKIKEKKFIGIPLGTDSKMGLCGLGNTDNICYMNSGLQCLCHSEDLKAYFLQDNLNLSGITDNKRIAKEFVKVLQNLYYGKSDYYTPSEFKTVMGKIESKFTGNRQQDCQEFLSSLLDHLHIDLNIATSRPKTLEDNKFHGLDDFKVARKYWKNHLRSNKSPIIDLFYGQYKSQIWCSECKTVRRVFDPFSILSLPIPNIYPKPREIEFYYIHSNNNKKHYKMIMEYRLQNHTLSQLKEALCSIIKIDPKRIHFFFIDYKSKKIISDEHKVLTEEMRRNIKDKDKNLFAIEISEEDYQASKNKNDDLINIDIQITKKCTNYMGDISRRNITFVRTITFLRTMTAKDVYFQVFKYLRFLYDPKWPEDDTENNINPDQEKKENNKQADNNDFSKLSDEEAFEKIFVKTEVKPFKVRFNTASLEECYFCGKMKCGNCELKYTDDIKLGKDIQDKIKFGDDYKLEFEIYLENIPDYIDLSRFNSFKTYPILNKKTEKEKKKKSTLTIYDCLEQFASPEFLNDEDFCYACRKNVKHIKKMEIYQAPPILIIHFKRFASNNNKLFHKIDYPITDFDLTDHFINPKCPIESQINSSNQQIEILDGQNKENLPLDNNSTNERALYDLFAVVNHFENLHSGHYTAFCKNFGEWYGYDDARVTKEDETKVCAAANYILFYRKKNFPSIF